MAVKVSLRMLEWYIHLVRMDGLDVADAARGSGARQPPVLPEPDWGVLPDLRDEDARPARYQLASLRQAEMDEAESRRLLGRFRADPLWAEMDAVERYHELPYVLDGAPCTHGGPCTHGERGIVDLLYRAGDRWTVAEFKTDRLAGPEAVQQQIKAKAYDEQVARYVTAAERLLGERPRALLVFMNVGRGMQVVEMSRTGFRSALPGASFCSRMGHRNRRRGSMTIGARFVHTNVVANDWRRLAHFYEEVFGCEPLLPERDLKGTWLEAATGVENAHVRGIHLRLPGYGDDGPTLEIFQYDCRVERPKTAVNRPGFGHIAFAVDDVEAAHTAVLAAGGGEIGEIVSLPVPGAGTVTFAYVTDPEGNVVELQRWAP
jgi:predicted enzyme related to lactoylglutathione lyase